MNGTRMWSEQQKAIFEQFKNGKNNTVVRARAGTGKTTTILEGIKYARDGKILLAAFNKKIAEELKTKLTNPNAEAKTLHSIGFGFIKRNWPHANLDDARGEKIAKAVLGSMAENVVLLNNVRKLAALGKNVCPFPKQSDLEDLAYSFELYPDEYNDSWTVHDLAKFAMAAMERATKDDGTIDFDDMVFVPVRNSWIRPKYDLVVIDEAQDMNASQLILARGVCKKTGRVFVVGDDRQAIYGFRGADAGSIDRLKSELKANELGLTITYRCPKRVVDLAARIVPDYKAADSAQDGEIAEMIFDKLHEVAKPGDFILSRSNAPLVKICLRLLRHNVRARIEGKDIAKGLMSIVKKVGGRDIINFLERLSRWRDKVVARLKATGEKAALIKVENVNDQYEVLKALAVDSKGMNELGVKLNTLFVDTGHEKASYVVCSSVHKAKGLETQTVYLLEETFRSGPIEEDNIRYVAITRAQRRLVFVNGVITQGE